MRENPRVRRPAHVRPPSDATWGNVSRAPWSAHGKGSRCKNLTSPNRQHPETSGAEAFDSQYCPPTPAAGRHAPNAHDRETRYMNRYTLLAFAALGPLALAA